MVQAPGFAIVESDLFTIGDLARASGLTISALRFYDRAGILRPAHVDPDTNYRWYAADQVRPARIVAGLRRVSMPLAEIGRVLAQPADAPALLDAHLRRLECGVADARRELSRVRSLIDLEESVMTTLTVPSAALAAAIDAVRFAASTDPALPALAGVLVELGDAGVRLVATDRFRLAVATASAAGAAAGREARAVAPPELLDEVRPLLTGTGSATVAIEGGTLRVGTGGHEVTGAALPYDFPDYRRLRPAGSARRVPVDVADLRAGLAAAGPAGVAVLSFGADDTVAVDASASGPAPGAVRVGVNPEFLLQALTAAGQPQLVLELDGPITPLVIRPAVPGAETFSLLMPVRITT
jgi:DNA-binding transcriptional MerR regulator